MNTIEWPEHPFTRNFPDELCDFAPYRYRCRIVRVSDGDTVVVVKDYGGLGKLRGEERLRIRGINAEEINDPDPVKRQQAIVAHEAVRTLCPRGLPVIATTYRPTRDRMEADILLPGLIDLATTLLDMGVVTAAPR